MLADLMYGGAAPGELVDGAGGLHDGHQHQGRDARHHDVQLDVGLPPSLAHLVRLLVRADRLA